MTILTLSTIVCFFTDTDDYDVSDYLELAYGLDPLDNADNDNVFNIDDVFNIDEVTADSDINVDGQPPVFTSIVEDIEVTLTGSATTVELVNSLASTLIVIYG